MSKSEDQPFQHASTLQWTGIGAHSPSANQTLQPCSRISARKSLHEDSVGDSAPSQTAKDGEAPGVEKKQHIFASLLLCHLSPRQSPPWTF